MDINYQITLLLNNAIVPYCYPVDARRFSRKILRFMKRPKA